MASQMQRRGDPELAAAGTAAVAMPAAAEQVCGGAEGSPSSDGGLGVFGGGLDDGVDELRAMVCSEGSGEAAPAQLPSAPEPVRSGQAVPPPPPPLFEPKKADAAVVDDGSGLTLNQQRALKSRMMGQGGAVARKTGGLAGPRLGLPPARPAPPSGPPPPSGPACGGNCAVS